MPWFYFSLFPPLSFGELYCFACFVRKDQTNALLWQLNAQGWVFFTCNINLQMHVAKKRFVSQGIKLSAEVKPFVPKHAAVTVAWSEPSEACVFPRYLTTCYPFVQEPSLDKYVYFLNFFLEGGLWFLTFQFWTLNTLVKSKLWYINILTRNACALSSWFRFLHLCYLGIYLVPFLLLPIACIVTEH